MSSSERLRASSCQFVTYQAPAGCAKGRAPHRRNCDPRVRCNIARDLILSSLALRWWHGFAVVRTRGMPRSVGLIGSVGGSQIGPICFTASDHLPHPVNCPSQLRQVLGHDAPDNFEVDFEAVCTSTLRNPAIARQGTSGSVALRPSLSFWVDSATVCKLRIAASCTNCDS